MKTFRFLMLLCVASVLLLACKKDPEDPFKGKFALNITVKAGSQAFQPFQVMTNHQDRKFLVEVMKLHLSDLALIREDGSEEVVHESLLYDFITNKVWKTDAPASEDAMIKAPLGKYKGIKFGIGVPASRNNGNPAIFPDTDPLHVNRSTHWSWATGYRFLIIEGRVDSSGAKDGANVNLGFAYHTGLNSLYRVVTFAGPGDGFEISDLTDGVFNLTLDINRLFVNGSDVIDVVANNVSHSTPENSPDYVLAKKITDNLAERALFK